MMTNLQKYVISGIDGEDYGADLKSDPERLAFLLRTFEAEHGWNVPRVGKRKALAGWLAGLPTCCTVAFYNGDVLAKGVELGLIRDDATEEQEDDFLNSWFQRCADAILSTNF